MDQRLSSGDEASRSTATATMPKMIHVGLGWIEDFGGGLERYQHGLCQAHANMGMDVAAWVQSRTPVSDDVNYNVVAYASQDQSRRRKLASLRELFLQQEDISSTLLVSHHASVGSHLFRLAKEGPRVVQFHGPWADEAAIEGAAWWKTALQLQHERETYRQADRIITLSECFRKIAIERFRVDPERVKVVPGGIDTDAADPGVSRDEARIRLGWPTDRPILISIRRLVHRVGVDVLVAAIARLKKRFDDLLVLIGGKGPLQGVLQEQIEAHGLQANVRLLGFVPEDELQLAYRAADYSILPTQDLEGFGLVALESMATGTPVLVTPIGSLPEVVSDLSESLIFESKSAEAIADGLQSILSGVTRLPSDQECKAYVRENFDWSAVAPRVLDVYREAIG